MDTQRPQMHSETPSGSHGDVPRSPELTEAIKRGYEPKDINLRGLFIFLGTLVVALVVVLAAIYGIMMALVDYDRSRDPLGTPVSISRPDPYAPLQPSVGHNVLDTDDMLAMREQVQETLYHPTLARQMPIDQAMDTVIPLLVVRPAIAPTTEPSYPEGSFEGRYSSSKVEPAAE